MAFEASYLKIVGGETRGVIAWLSRAALSGVTPLYSTAVRGRNRLYDLGLKSSIELPRPTVSVGNLTVGGTGKTPVVAHLATSLAARGFAPAVLMRGYKAGAGEKGDEQRLLESLLGDAVPIEANAERAAAARNVLARRPGTDVFLLDDGFQHRRVRRAFDLVLVDATRPFGHGRVLPRGLLREPVAGLSRASAVLITRGDHVSGERVAEITAAVRRRTSVPVFVSSFEPGGLLAADGKAAEPSDGLRVLAACGVGNPDAFLFDLRRRRLDVAALRRFADHHDYDAVDVESMLAAARDVGAAAVVTTGKDWVKLRPIWPANAVAFVAPQRLHFASPAEETRLLDAVVSAIRPAATRGD